MHKTGLGAYAVLLAATAAFVVFTPPPIAVTAAMAPESNQTIEESQSFTVSEEAKTPELDRGTYSATTPEELQEIQAKRAAEEEAKRVAEEKQKQEEAAAKASTTSVSSAPLYSGGGSKNEWMSAAGIAESDWGYVDYIVSKESGWNPNAVNKSSGASGLVQALPCGKVPGSCFNPVDNLKWADGYAKGRYGSWAGAYDFWTANHWW